MTLRGNPPLADFEGIADEAIATVERWRNVTDVVIPADEARLNRVLHDASGGRYVLDFIDGVLGPEDLRVAARNLDRVSRALPVTANWVEGIGTQFAGGFAPLVPSAMVPMARESFLRLVGHLFLRGDSLSIDKQLGVLSQPGGIRPTIVPLTATASGAREIHRQVSDIHDLLHREAVETVLVRPSAFVGRPRLVNLDAEVNSAVDAVCPLAETAAQSPKPKLIILDVTTFDELELSLRVFERVIARYPNLDFGISLPASLPDSLPALDRIMGTARARRAAGGAEITVRFTRGEFLRDERERASLHGWKAAPFSRRLETDAQYLRLLDRALAAHRNSGIRVISATHNLFTVAFAWRLARARGVERRLEHEFMLGVTTQQREVVKRDVGGVRLFTPIVQPGHQPQVVPYLTQRVEDFTQSEGYLESSVRLSGTECFVHEREKFRAAVDISQVEPVRTHRTQNLVRTEVADFSLEQTRQWAHAMYESAKDSASGEARLARSMISTEAERESLVAEALRHGASWGERRGSTRATVLESVAEIFSEWRGLLVEMVISECGMTVEEADVEVTVAIALAHRAAEGAREVDDIHGAVFRPPRLVVVVSSRSAPITDLAQSVLSALAAGGSVILKTAPETRRASAVFVDTLVAGGLPEGLVTILDDEGELAESLISDPRVDHVLHSGSRHVAKLFHSWRAETRLSSTTGGRNSSIVTPSADLEAAVSHIVESAMGVAGQLPLSTGCVILVGSVATSARFLGRLTDAISSISVTVAPTEGSALSALARSADAQQRAALETLGDGERWRVQPRQLDTRGRIWTAGLRDGVEPDSPFHRAEQRVPVLGIMRADTLEHAIELQNSLGFGLSAALYSRDADEIDVWRNSVEAGLTAVNTPVTSIVRALAPVEGWNRARFGTVSPGSKDAVIALGSWSDVETETGATVTLDGMSEPVAQVITAAQASMSFAEFDHVRAGARSDEEAWVNTYAPTDILHSEFERIELRYLPVPVTIRVSEGASTVDFVRVLVAATRAGAAVVVSSAVPLHSDLIELFRLPDSPVGVAEVLVESDARWRARVQAGEIVTSRIRLIGGDPVILARVLHDRPGIAVHSSPVTTSGRVELLPFLRGQSTCARVQPIA